MNVLKCRRLWTVALCALLLVWGSTARAQSSENAKLEKVLAEMDSASAKFHSTQANFQWDQFELVVNSTDTQAGVIYFLRNGASTNVAVDIDTADGQPAKKYIVLSDGVLKFYQPQINQMTIMHAGSNQSQWESYLTIGFGGSGTELKKSWEITYQGMEAIDGVQTVKLDLVNKSDTARNNFSHITIWVDPTRAISLKQILFEPSGDTKTCYFRNIEYNKQIPSSVFKIKTDSKTQVIQR
jgi:outer membrane lipoprotein-sorting protein